MKDNFRDNWRPLDETMPQSQPSLIKRLVETDHAGRILYVTPEAGRLFPVTSRELSGRDLFRLFDRSDGQSLRTILRTAIADGQTSAPATATILRPRERGLQVHVSAVRLDARRVQWRLIRTDEA
jgi:PAS domain S-box-containing protein